MRRWIRRALTKTVSVKGPRGTTRKVEVEPSETLVYGVTFATASLLALTSLQIAHLAVLGRWNSEIFAAITGLIGTIMGVFFGKQA